MNAGTSTNPAEDPRSTRTDLRLTRAPADTPRGRLHRAAAMGIRAAHEAARFITIDEDTASLRAIARRCVIHLRRDGSQAARFIVHVCHGLDRALSALTLLGDPGFAMLCDELTKTLVLLEVAETKAVELEVKLGNAARDLAFERSHSEQMRSSLAAAAVRTAAAEAEKEPAEGWDTPTRSRTMTEQEKRVVSDPDAAPGDLERYLREENDSLRAARDQHARIAADLRGEVRELYASYVALIGRLRKHESVESTEVRRLRHHDALNGLGVYDIGPR